MHCPERPRRRLSAVVVPSLALLIFHPPAAFSHDAPAGWAYPFACCSGRDCREVPDKAISERPQGYVINSTGEVVGYHDARLRNSPDGEYHWCSVSGANNTRTICLFVPPKSF